MSRCYPFPPPGYEKKAPQLSADVAQPHKDKKDKHKHKDKKKKRKKDGDANGDTHDKDSSRPSKQQPRTDLINEPLQPPKEEKQNGKVRGNVLPTERIQSTSGAVLPTDRMQSTSGAVLPTDRMQSTSGAVEPLLGVPGPHKNNRASARSVSERIPPAAAVPPVGAVPSQPLYSKQEPNGKVVDAKPVLVLPPESSSSRPGSSSNLISNQPTNNLDAQRQSPELPAAGEILVLKQPSAWSDVPDEDWLFAGRPPLGSHPKPKAEVERGARRGLEPLQQVWAEAVFLPSCDLYALPYVVPY